MDQAPRAELRADLVVHEEVIAASRKRLGVIGAIILAVVLVVGGMDAGKMYALGFQGTPSRGSVTGQVMSGSGRSMSTRDLTAESPQTETLGITLAIAVKTSKFDHRVLQSGS